MTFNDRLTSFGGLQVVQWQPGQGPLDTATQMPKFAVEFDSDVSWSERFAAYLQLPNASTTQGLVIGTWSPEMYDEADPDAVIDDLVAATAQLPQLRVLFFGDITFEEAEVSWICNTNQSRLYAAYPNLEFLAIRGGMNLQLPGLAMPRLSTLVIETGGLDVSTLQQVLTADLPALSTLQLYFGDEFYGATTSITDLQPLLSGELFPQLRYLGLQNAQYTDAIAEAIVTSPLLERLAVLDLSLGTLTDVGARALAASPGVRSLLRLNLEHNFLTEEGKALLAGLAEHGVDVDLSDNLADEEPYVAIGE